MASTKRPPEAPESVAADGLPGKVRGKVRTALGGVFTAGGGRIGTLIILIALCAVFSVTSDSFLSTNNLLNILQQYSVVGILAVAQTIVIISAGIDLSTASATAATAMVLGLTLQAGWGIALVLIVTILFGLFLGLLNGFMITKLKISFLV